MWALVVTATLFVLTLSKEENQYQYPFALHADDKMNWADANSFCASTYGTTLATISNDDEAATILAMVQAADCGTGSVGTRNTWIGLNDLDTKGTYEWVNGEECDGDCNELSWWKSGQPNSGSQRCGNIRYNANAVTNLLNDGTCSNKLCFICDVRYEVTEEACDDDLFISSAEECEAAADALGIKWNSCCQNNNNLPYGCLKRSDNDIIWNGNADTPNQFPCTVAGNCDHGMRWAVCRRGHTETTIDPTMNPTPDPTPGPTMNPTNNPSPDPTPGPTINPTSNPTMNPTASPTSPAVHRGYSSRIANAQCYTDEVEYSGDRLDNPIFEGGGFIGTMTLSACQAACNSMTDSQGRSCVAIEWSDGGNEQSDSTTKSCALAWACDWTEPWSGGSVFMKDEYVTRNARAQCYVEQTEYSGDRLDNPIFEGGGFIGSMTLSECLEQCGSRTDSKGRSCVAVEWSDGGAVQSDSTKKNCALAWGCDYTKYWGGGSVFMKDDYAEWNFNAQCYVEETEYSGDRLDNPIFEGGGHIGTMTLSDCKAQCASSTDSDGRPCVAIEWKDGGNAQSDSTTKKCALAWGCDYTTYWGGGSVYVRPGNALYGYDQSWAAKVAFAEYPQPDFLSKPEQMTWTVTLSFKDFVVLALIAVNVATIVALYFVCTKSRAHAVRQKKYQMVRMDGDTESEEVGLQ